VTTARRIGAIAITLAVATTSPAPAFAAQEDATALALAADAAHESGRHGEAAELYAKAYHAMTPEEKDALGEIIVAAALDDLHTRWEATADPSLPSTAGDLLDEYERDTGRSAEGSLAEHRAWVATVRDVSEPVLDDEPPPSVAGATELPPARERDRVPAPREGVAPALIVVGIATTIGGTAMIALGAPLGRRAERGREEALSSMPFHALDPEDPDTIAYVEGYDAYVRHEQQRTRALVGVGSVLLAAGVGVAVYGIVRLARHRRAVRAESARVRPIVGGAAF
jgi:hypothetical protein